ncbi:MAG: polyamine aminopropyltransferase [Deltaproteobacteria bacterium]|nr:polyamine aminopropyltransferase [Deltaproteobacteria bacterium]
MSAHGGLPPALIDGGSLPETSGFEEDNWYYEEDQGLSRMGIRFSAKLHVEQTPFQKLVIYDTQFFGKLLTLDDVVMFTERDEFAYHEMLIHVPLCSMPEPRRVLIIGGGDCGCLREALKHPSLEEVIQCDIDERVTKACAPFFDWIQPAMDHAKSKLLFEDGVALIERHENSFDLIVVDSTDPKGPGVGLFTADFYAKVRRALTADGVMVAQTESPFWDPAMLGAIYEQIRQAFDQVVTYVGAAPSYPSGNWSWAYASNQRKPSDHFNELQAARLENECLYYNRQIHQACFALPTFMHKALRGENPFARFEPIPEK